MDIVTLKITNFLSLGDAPMLHLHNKGLILVQGVNEDDTSANSNGVGKSSIADALCWALYGQTARDESGDAVVNETAKKNCSVQVMLRDGESGYRITRYRKHKEFKNQTVVEAASGEGGLWVNISKGTEKETQELINSIMGCSVDVFMGAIYAGQEVAPDLPAMTDKQLKLLIEEAAGVERLESAYEIARKRLGAAKEALTLSQAVLDSFKRDFESANADLAKKQLDAEMFETGRGERASAFKEVAETHRATLVGYLTTMKGIDHLALAERSTALSSTLAGHSEMVEKRDKLASVHGNDQRYLDRLETAHAANMKAVTAAKAKLDNAATEILKPCTECGKPGDAHDLETFKEHMTASVRKYVELAKESKAAVEKQKKIVEESAAELAAFEKTIPNVSESSREQREIAEKLKKHAELKLLASQAKASMDRQNELSVAALTETNPHTSAIDMLKERIEKIGEDLKTRSEGVLDLENKLQTAQDVASVFSPAGVRAHILDTVTPFLNERTSDYLSALSDGNISAVWTTLSTTAKGEMREKFCIEVSNDKGAKSFKGLSGGEKRKVRLSTMLALQDLVSSRATKPINLWLGDEIDNALDSAGLERLMGILERKARERGTVLVISHNPMRDWIDQVVTVIKREGVSTVEGALV